MSILNWIDRCDDCTTCVGCGHRWCRGEEVSPGEADGTCRECFEIEDPEADR